MTFDFKNLEKILDQFYPDNLDGNPSGLAIRVLKAFRARCESKFEKLEGLPTEQLIVCQMINQLQEKRLAEIDKAIELLESAEAEEIVREAIRKQGW